MTQSPVETSILPRLPMTKRLRDVLAEQTGKPVGLGSIPKVPDPDDPAAFVTVPPPYLLLFPLWSSYSGPWNAPQADVTWIYQVSGYSTRIDQIDWLRDRVLTTMLGRVDGEFVVPIEVAGMKVMQRSIVEDAGADPTAVGGVFPIDLRFALSVTPVRA